MSRFVRKPPYTRLGVYGHVDEGHPCTGPGHLSDNSRGPPGNAPNGNSRPLDIYSKSLLSDYSAPGCLPACCLSDASWSLLSNLG